MQALFSTRYFISDVRLETQFIVHCWAKIIKSGAESNHCAIQRKLFKILVGGLRWVVKSTSFVSVGFSSKSLDLHKRIILLIASKYK